MELKLPIKWGLILFLATLIWMYFEKIMGWHGENIMDHALYTNLYDIVFALIYYLAFTEYRNSKDEVSFKDGLFFGIKLTAFIAFVSPITQSVIHKIISPEFFPNIIKLAVDNKILSPEQAKAQFNLASYIIQNFIGTAILGIIMTLIIATLRRKKTHVT